MRIQQMIIGMMLLLSLGLAQAEGEARHFMGIYSDSYSNDELNANSYQYGYDFSNLISLELNYSAPTVADTSTTLTTVDSLYSLMMRFNKRYESINTYFMIGGSGIAFTNATAVDESYTGVSYGLGIELYGSRNTAISFTWMTTEFDEASTIPDLSVTRVGLIHHFDFAKSVGRY
ncbi:MAG: porin family protein [Gammaproteobacteria bacterium]|nr:porin family protein [Gammaproteobacteria bacterium]